MAEWLKAFRSFMRGNARKGIGGSNPPLSAIPRVSSRRHHSLICARVVGGSCRYAGLILWSR